MKKSLIGLFYLGLALWGSVAQAQELHDLSPFTTVKLDVELRTLESGERTPHVFFNIENKHTNSLVCAVDIAVPVSKNSIDGVFEVSQTDVVIFPASAFDQPISYRVDTSRIPSDRTIQLAVTTRLVGAATCTGWTLGKRLPRRACLALNSNHDQLCVNVRAGGRDYYPVVRGRDLHVGDCGC